MADPFATALAAHYASGMAVAAVFTPAGAPSVDLRAIRYEREAGALLGPGNLSRALRYELQTIDVPVQPTRGATLTEARGVFAVQNATLIGDVAAGVWLCDVTGPA